MIVTIIEKKRQDVKYLRRFYQKKRWILSIFLQLFENIRYKESTPLMSALV